MTTCIIDTETTGTSPWSRVVEIGALALGPGGQTLGTFESLLFPDVLDERADRALERSGLSRAEVEAAPPADDVIADFTRWLDNYSVTEVWSYNRAFDQAMLERSGVYLPWKGCVMRLCRENMRWLKKDPSLGDAAAHFGILTRARKKHRALDDAKVAAELFCRLHR
jgi:DNA polymerase III epsilon subunit-like protein